MTERPGQQELAGYLQKCRSAVQQRYAQPPLAHVHTFGCQQNESDGEKLCGMLAEMGYGFTDDPANADLILYNTCAIRQNAEDRVLGNTGALKHLKEQRPELIIGLCGCMVQQQHVAQKVKMSYPYVDLVFGTEALYRFPQLFYRILTGKRRVFDLENESRPAIEGIPVRRGGAVKAWLPIMHGCDNFCTYCIVPYVRGRERSRRPEDVLEEARGLIAAGYREITLLGQNVNSYGKGLEPAVDFAGLLSQLDAIEGEFRIRFMTSHPKDYSRELVDVIARSEKICHHIHLPVQSGSDRILKAMNRHYDIGRYREALAYTREKIPDVTFTSDIIVGFPGETREDFEQTLALVREVGYSTLYTFLYSPREGTRATQLPDPVSAQEKSAWFQELVETQRQIGADKHRELVGQTVRVLVEGAGHSGPGYLTGRTEHNIIVDFPAGKEEIGKFVDIKVTQAHNWAVVGELIEK